MGELSRRIRGTSLPSQVRDDQAILLGELRYVGLPSLGASPEVVQEEKRMPSPTAS